MTKKIKKASQIMDKELPRKHTKSLMQNGIGNWEAVGIWQWTMKCRGGDKLARVSHL